MIAFCVNHFPVSTATTVSFFHYLYVQMDIVRIILISYRLREEQIRFLESGKRQDLKLQGSCLASYWARMTSLIKAGL